MSNHTNNLQYQHGHDTAAHNQRLSEQRSRQKIADAAHRLQESIGNHLGADEMAHIRGRADVMNHACRLIDDLARIRLHSANQAVEIAYLKDQNAASEAAQADNIARIAHLEDVKAHLEDRIASLEADRAYVMNAIGQEGI